MAASPIAIEFEGTDITADAVVADTSFTSQASAQVGNASVGIRDRERTHSFTVGGELTCDIDGQRLWGGYVTQPTMKFWFPAVKTSVLSEGDPAQVRLQAVDYNVLFDKRVLRNESDFLHQLPNFTKDKYDGYLIRSVLCPNYLDLPTDLDYTTYVDDVVPPFDPLNAGLSGDGAWLQQGSLWRAAMEDLAQFSGSVWYIRGVTGGGKELHYHSLETVQAPWGFSDVPALAEIDTGDPYIGFRELEASEDGSVLVNDAMIWGGSEFAGSGQTVFYRQQDATSITAHHRWQLAETHFGEEGYKLADGVEARAKVIVLGDPGSVGGDANRGLRYSQWNVKLSWYADRVPVISGTKQHLKPGDIVTFRFYALGDDGGTTPLTLVLPLRSLQIDFPAKPQAPNETWVKFTGTFSLQLTDPKTLWTFLRRAQKKAIASVRPVIATSDGSSGQAVYGSYFTGPMNESPDGSRTVFHLQGLIGYIGGTTRLYRNRLLQIPGTDYTESDPGSSELTFTVAPGGSDTIWCQCRLTG